MNMVKTNELSLVKYALQEIKDQYKIHLEEFDDIKNKNQILLLICSLIITLPISSELVIKKILSLNIFIEFFISGVICLVIAILLLIVSMMNTPLRIPLFEDIMEAIGKYKEVNIMKSIARTYAEDLSINIIKIEEKRKIIRIAEKFIISGIILVTGTLIIIFVFRIKA